MDDQPVIVAVSQLHGVKMIDGGRTIAVMLQSTDGRDLAVLVSATVAEDLRVKLITGLDEAVRVLASQGD